MPSEIAGGSEPQEDVAAGAPAPAVQRRAILALTVWNLFFDQARGNFASQADQNLALKLCGGDSVRTVQMQTYVTSASAVAQFASNQLVGRWCAFNLKKIRLGLSVDLPAGLPVACCGAEVGRCRSGATPSDANRCW